MRLHETLYKNALFIYLLSMPVRQLIVMHSQLSFVYAQHILTEWANTIYCGHGKKLSFVHQLV